MNQPSEVGGWEAGGSLSHPSKGERRVAERGVCSAVGGIQIRPQQGPFSIDSSGSLVKEMGKLRPRNRGGDLTKVMQQVAGKGQAHPPFQTRPTAATDLMPRG